MTTATTRQGSDRHIEVHQQSEQLELSIIMPCLNEANTVGGCVEEAMRAIKEGGIRAEVIVADNGSTDGSQEIATRLGARVVPISKKGYGHALMGGFAAAKGKYLIMGDSDLSYNFGDAMKFVVKLREGYDVVMGNRFEGGFEKGAMPWKNRYFGNPLLSFIGRTFFRIPCGDLYCGLRGLTREAYDKVNPRAPGMEFAYDMLVKASLMGLKIGEVPTKLRKDGRGRPPHLRPWRDGWRTLRFMLLHSPRWALFLPGLLLLAIGLVVGGLTAFGGLRIGGVHFDVHTLLAGSLAVLIGYQWMTMAVLMRRHGAVGVVETPTMVDKLLGLLTVERGLILGGVLILAGLIPMGWLIWSWADTGFGNLEIQRTLRPTIVGFTAIALGVQTALMTLVGGMLQARSDAASL